MTPFSSVICFYVVVGQIVSPSDMQRICPVIVELSPAPDKHV